MNKILALTVVGVVILTTIVSCKKYEEGPIISFKSKKERVANTWQIEKAYRNGEDVTDDYDQFELQLKSDGDARLVSSYTFANATFEYETDGTWEFSDKKENLKMDFEDDDADNTFQILKLKEKELWLREKGGEDELHLMPK